MNGLEFANDNSKISQELLEVVKAVQEALNEKRARLQIEAIDGGPSALEAAYAQERAKRPVLPRAIATHPKLLAAVVESADAAIISETVDGIVLTWNKGAERIFGFTDEDVIGESHIVMFPDFLKNEEAKLWKRVTAGVSISNYETVRQDREGRLVDVSMSISPILEDDKVTRVVIVAHDITERKSMDRALMQSERMQRDRLAQLKTVLDSVPTPVWIAHDTECKEITGNKAAYNLLRLPQGSNLSLSSPAQKMPYAIYRNGRVLAPHELPVQMAASRGIDVQDFEQDLVFDDGTIKHIVGNATPLRDPNGNVTGAVSAAIDITARKGAEEQIRKMAHFDALTNLPNRVLLMDRLEHAIAMSARNQTHTGVIFIDLDHFKSINDTLGHHVGDLLLQQVADRLREDVREVDTVSRLGGDEFLIIVPELRQVDDARHISRKLLQSLSEPYVITGQKLEVTPSIGVSVFPDDGTEPSALIRLADQAMYQAKQEGRRTIRFYRNSGNASS
ncbi:MAG: diguanylate cyclase [Betaproteobacteria bacterium]|nr:MAG: diguanylate cyclase [Betaproteobacteria bacterium]